MEWGRYHIGDLFDVRRPAARNKDDYTDGSVPFVASGAVNNGVMKCCEPREGEALDEGRCITVSPVDGSAFYQPADFLGRGGAGSSVLMLYSDEPIDEWSGQFIARMISQTCSKYTYGHMGNKEGIRRETVQLPVAPGGGPDWAYMSSFVAGLRDRLLSRYRRHAEARLAELEHVEIPRLDEVEWRPIALSSIGTIESGRDIYETERVPGDTPYITAGSQNNGVGYFVGNDNATRDRDFIAFNRNGAVGYAFYHPYWALMGNDCRKLNLGEGLDNFFVGEFVATCISMQRVCFSYSRKLGTARAEKMKIMLPIADDGAPDWAYMEQYAKNVMIEKYERWLAYIDGRKAGPVL